MYDLMVKTLSIHWYTRQQEGEGAISVRGYMSELWD